MIVNSFQFAVVGSGTFNTTTPPRLSTRFLILHRHAHSDWPGSVPSTASRVSLPPHPFSNATLLGPDASSALLSIHAQDHVIPFTELSTTTSDQMTPRPPMHSSHSRRAMSRNSQKGSAPLFPLLAFHLMATPSLDFLASGALGVQPEWDRLTIGEIGRL